MICHVTSLIFFLGGGISDSISLTVQDRDIVGTLIGNRMWPIEWYIANAIE